MEKSALFGLSVIFFGSVFVWGCSSKKEDGRDNSGNAGASPDIGNSLAQAANGSFGDAKGGTEEISLERANEIETAACVGWKAEPESGPATLMLVVDTSQSMQNNAPNSTQSKWVLTQEALTQAVQNLSGSTFAGLFFYPNRPTTASRGNQQQDAAVCIDVNGVIPVAQLGNDNSAERRVLLDALGAARPQGCTPTHNAIVHARDHGLLAANGGGKQYLLLITDGQPTLGLGCVGSCNPAQPNDTRPIVDEIARTYADNGIATFVIGSPGSEQNETTGEDVRGWLSEAARAGGTATPGCSDSGPNFCHFDMSQERDFGTALKEALTTITGQIAACSYTIPKASNGQTVDREAVNLIVKSTDGSSAPKRVLYSATADCSEGWYFDDSGRVTLCTDSCFDVQKNPKTKLQLLFGCATNAPVLE